MAKIILAAQASLTLGEKLPNQKKKKKSSVSERVLEGWGRSDLKQPHTILSGSPLITKQEHKTLKNVVYN